MEAIQVERRAARSSATVDPASTRITSIVRQGILLQTCVGTIGAVEYLKAYEVDGRVINRVLSGGGMREEDKPGLDSLYLTG